MKPESIVQENLIRDGVAQYMDKILFALNTGNNKEATQQFIEFGAFLQRHYPGLDLDALRKQLKKLIAEQFYHCDIPRLDFIPYYIEARMMLYQEVVSDRDHPDQNSIYKMDAAIKGLNIFSLLLEDERWEDALNAQMKEQAFDDDDDLENARQLICETPYQMHEQLLMAIRSSAEEAMLKRQAQNYVSAIRSNIKRTQEKLMQVIVNKIRKHPDLYQQYSDENGVDITRFDEGLKSDPESDEHSVKIRMAVASYVALASLAQTIDEAGDIPPQKILARVQLCLEGDSPIKSALETNPDKDVVKFFKVLTYILKCAVTFTAYHWITEGESLRSTQQQYLKETLKTLENAEENGFIDSESDQSPGMKM